MPRLLLPLLVLACWLLAVGCAPKIGDSCNNSTDCSVNGDRICDVAAPRGYCTVRGCDPDTCPGTSVCVEWRSTPERTAETWCMERCSKDGGCRQGDGYRCVDEDDPRLLDREGLPLANILDLDHKEKHGFCAAVNAGD